jgi:DNA-binding transcriptional regulator YdaS (Cro superfamily)
MTKDEAIKRAGSQAALARVLGVSRGAVWQWKAIPSGRLYQLMVVRPDWFDKV